MNIDIGRQFMSVGDNFLTIKISFIESDICFGEF